TGIVQPSDGVRLPRYVPDRVDRQNRAIVFRVDLIEIDGPGGEMRGHFRARQVDDGDVVVFLQRDDRLVRVVDVHEFGFGIVGGKAGQVGVAQARAVGNAVLHAKDGKSSGRQLGNFAVVHVLVALVLDGDGDEGAIGTGRDGVGLPGKVAAQLDIPARDVDD